MRLDLQTCGFHINSLDTNIDANVQSRSICKLLRHLCALVHDQSHKVFANRLYPQYLRIHFLSGIRKIHR